MLPEHQGQGFASTAASQATALARATSRRATLDAFPSVDNPASNAICRRLGFALRGQGRFEYSKGSWMGCNHWRLGLI